MHGVRVRVRFMYTEMSHNVKEKHIEEREIYHSTASWSTWVLPPLGNKHRWVNLVGDSAVTSQCRLGSNPNSLGLDLNTQYRFRYNPQSIGLDLNPTV